MPHSNLTTTTKWLNNNNKNNKKNSGMGYLGSEILPKVQKTQCF